VKQLKECETMGNIDSLCLTKTGFISKNLLSVSEIFVEERTTNIVSREIMSANTCHLLGLAIVMNTQATPKFIESNGSSLSIEHVGNKTESALLEMAYRLGYHY
jgi:magnesium-transporting ATPase (P-type)